MFSVDYIFLLNITYVFENITCLGFLVLHGLRFQKNTIMYLSTYLYCNTYIILFSLLSRSGSPSVTAGSLHRLYQTPSPKPRSPAALARTPVSMNVSSLNESYSEVAEPLAPEICLEHMWSETTTARR